jgi:hypothetical protein
MVEALAQVPCGARWEIRVHFDRGCTLAHGGDHFHRICRCGEEWLERCDSGPRDEFTR